MSSIKYQTNIDSLEQARQQVDEMKGLMKTEIEKVLERDNKLSHLEERADRLQEQSEQNFGHHRVGIRKKKRPFGKTGKCALL